MTLPRDRRIRSALDVDDSAIADGYGLLYDAAAKMHEYAQWQRHGETTAAFVGTASIATSPAYTHYRLSGAVTPQIKGLGISAWDDPSGAVIYVTNVGVTDITFLYEAGAATANTRIWSIGGLNPVLAVGETWFLVYDGTTQRWRVPDALVSSYVAGYSFTENDARSIINIMNGTGHLFMNGYTAIEEDARHIVGLFREKA